MRTINVSRGTSRRFINFAGFRFKIIGVRENKIIIESPWNWTREKIDAWKLFQQI